MQKKEKTVIEKLIEKSLWTKPLRSEKIKETDIQNIINQAHGPLKRNGVLKERVNGPNRGSCRVIPTCHV